MSNRYSFPDQPISTAHGKCSRAPQRRPSEDFQYLCTNVMKTNKGTQAAIPHRDTRSSISLAWLSIPRGQSNSTNNRRAHIELRRIGHGSARAIKNLRGLRQPFLPLPNSEQDLLPGLPDKIEGLSITREPQAAGTAEPQDSGQGLGGG